MRIMRSSNPRLTSSPSNDSSTTNTMRWPRSASTFAIATQLLVGPHAPGSGKKAIVLRSTSVIRSAPLGRPRRRAPGSRTPRSERHRCRRDPGRGCRCRRSSLGSWARRGRWTSPWPASLHVRPPGRGKITEPISSLESTSQSRWNQNPLPPRAADRPLSLATMSGPAPHGDLIERSCSATQARDPVPFEVGKIALAHHHQIAFGEQRLTRPQFLVPREARHDRARTRSRNRLDHRSATPREGRRPHVRRRGAAPRPASPPTHRAASGNHRPPRAGSLHRRGHRRPHPRPLAPARTTRRGSPRGRPGRAWGPAEAVGRRRDRRSSCPASRSDATQRPRRGARRHRARRPPGGRPTAMEPRSGRCWPCAGTMPQARHAGRRSRRAHTIWAAARRPLSTAPST